MAIGMKVNKMNCQKCKHKMEEYYREPNGLIFICSNEKCLFYGIVRENCSGAE